MSNTNCTRTSSSTLGGSSVVWPQGYKMYCKEEFFSVKVAKIYTQKQYIAVRPCKWIKGTMRQRANGISAMGSLCSYSVCTLTHFAFDPFAWPHSDIYSYQIPKYF
jgi:hypothetical protein